MTETERSEQIFEALVEARKLVALASFMKEFPAHFGEQFREFLRRTKVMVESKTVTPPTPPVKIKRNLSTPEARAYWAHAEECAAEVRTWPASKRAGINVSDRRVASAQQGEMSCNKVGKRS